MNSLSSVAKLFRKPSPRSLYGLLLVMGAFLAALMVFVRSPEEIRVRSNDGRVELSGSAPRRLGLFQITKNESMSAVAHTALVAPVYEILPANTVSPLPLHLSMTYNSSELAGRNPIDLSVVRFDGMYGRWEALPSTVDLMTHTVNADTRILGIWSLAYREDPGVPTEFSDLINQLKSPAGAPPPRAVGFTVDLEYAKATDDFVLYRPAFIRDGCQGFFNGEEEKIIGYVVTVGEITYRATITWEIGDTDRCNW